MLAARQLPPTYLTSRLERRAEFRSGEREKISVLLAEPTPSFTFVPTCPHQLDASNTSFFTSSLLLQVIKIVGESKEIVDKALAEYSDMKV